VERYRRRASDIASGRSGLRLEVPEDRDDEVTRLGHTLNRMLDTLESALERERRFINDASHELRTPLTVLRGELELASQDPDPEQVRRSVVLALAEAEALSALADDLLVLARQRGGDLQLHREAVDLGGWLGTVVRDLRGAWPCDVRVAAPGRTTVWVDPVRLRQVVANLVSNAAAAGATCVLLGAGPDGELDVSDDGPGFDPALLPRVFERFARGSASRSRETGSTGLGLAIVASLVAGHGGTVDVETPPGHGARFTVRLPVRGATAREPSRTPGAGTTADVG